MKNKKNCLGEETSDQNVILLFLFFLESISILPGSGNKAKAFFGGIEISSKLVGKGGWVGGSLGKVCGGIVPTPMSKLGMGQVLGFVLIVKTSEKLSMAREQ